MWLYIYNQLCNCYNNCNLHAGLNSVCSDELASMTYSPTDVGRLKSRYLRLLPTAKTGWPKHKVTQYVKLCIVENEGATLRDKNLNEVTRLTLQGDVDKILKKKKPLGDLKDIFHFKNRACPRLIVIMGGPG